jgi:hypothetical protein
MPKSTFHSLTSNCLILLFGSISHLSRAESTRTVEMTVDADRDVHPISQWIYGINGLYEQKETPDRKPACTIVRLGGNRTTAWNWVNNASNAGHDWHHQNDSFFGKPDAGLAAAAKQILDYTQANGMAAIMPIPIIGRVSADHGPGGDVMKPGTNWLDTRFRRSVAAKSAPFTLEPDPNHPVVYQDEFVNWLRVKYPDAFNGSAKPVFFSLDNEVDLWAHTHPRLRGITVPDGEEVPKEIERGGKVGYEEIVRLNIEYARAIKAVIPTAKVLGPVVWSWAGVNNLSGATDANGRHFAEYYLTKMAEAERSSRRRLIDCFTLNQYSAATAKVGGKEIGVTSDDTSPEVVAARLQAPRSFWDPSYVENSWLAGGKPLRMFPALREMIDQDYPGTQIAITEYNFGARHHISGGLAQADFLGILGRERISLATWWSLGKGGIFALGAFDLYRNFDGKGGTFGNRAIHAATSDPEATSIYAANDTARNGAMTIIAINKTSAPLAARIRISTTAHFGGGTTWQLTEASPKPEPGGPLQPVGDRNILYTMPPFSASLLDFVTLPSKESD